MNLFLFIFVSALFSTSVFAMNGRTTYQAKIIKSDGFPLEANSVNFQFTILDTTGSCILYTESYSAINMTSTGGLISFALGNGTRGFPGASATTAVFANVFDNAITTMPCQPSGTYNPLPNDTRRIVMQFNDGAGWHTLPAMTINAVPYAMYASKANNSLTLNGKADTAFVENATLATLNCNPATHAITFNGASFSCIAVGGGGGGGISSVTTSGTVLTTGGTASAPVISIQRASGSQDGYLASSDWTAFSNKLNSSSNLSDLGNVAQARSNLGLGALATASTVDLGSASATGTISDARFVDQVNITSGTQYTKITVDSKGRVTSGAQLSQGDITTALGYAPASSTPWATSGTTINYINGNVGIGTSNPTTTLHVEGSGQLSAESGVAAMILRSGDISGAVAPQITFRSSRGSISSSTALQVNDVVGGFFGAPYNGSSYAHNAFFGFLTDSASQGTAIRFTTGTSGIRSERLRITSTGNLGVGLASPTARLHLVSGTLTVAPLKLTSGTLLSSPASGSIEYDGSQLYFTDGLDIRRALATHSTPGSFDNTSSISNTSGNITLSPNNITGSVIVNSSSASISPSTGALVVNGGMGIAGSIYSSGTIITSSNIQGSSITATSGINTNVIQGNTDLFINPNGGNVGIGTNAPSTQLEVSGTVKITGGAPGAGKVLTSDASGLASWATSTVSGGLISTNNLSDLTSATVARNNLGLGSLAILSSVDLSGSQASGTLAIARLPAFTGDVTASAASNNLILANSGVSASVYTKVTVDAKGRVTSGAQLASSDISTALGYMPMNPASASAVAGSDMQVQYNSSGTQTASPSFAYDDTNKRLSVAGLSNNKATLALDTAGNSGLGRVGAGYLTLFDAGSSAAYFASSYLGVAGNNLYLNYAGGSATFLRGNNNAANPFEIGYGGTTFLTINQTSGNVGISSGTPGARLVVKGAGTTSTTSGLNITNSSNTSILSVRDDGNVGIGTNAPQSKLTIKTDAIGAAPATPDNSGISLINSTAAANGAQQASPAIHWQGYGWETMDPLSLPVDYRAFVVPVQSVGSNPASYLTFQSKYSGTYYDRMVIKTSNFNVTTVGIGTTAPLSKLDVNGGLAIGSYAGANAAPSNGMIISGNVGIGTTSPSFKLDVSGTIRGYGITDSSDIRLKQNIKPLDFSLEKILSIKGYSYHWRDRSMPKKQIGFIAQELEKIFPELVETDNEGIKSVNYSHLVAPMVEAIKSLYKRITGVESEVHLLQRRMASVEETSKRLENENEVLKKYICQKDPSAGFCDQIKISK